MTVDPYVKLCTTLGVLAAETSAHLAAVLDENGHLYGSSDPLDPVELRALGSLFDDVLASAERPLHRGGHVHLLRGDREPFVAAQSFAGIYVLLLTFENRPAPSVASRIKHALPEIEAMTVTLPPDDPGDETGAMARRR